MVLIRILGGLDYWRYGAEQAALSAERSGVTLIIVPGCDKPMSGFTATRRFRPMSRTRLAMLSRWRGLENAGLALGVG